MDRLPDKGLYKLTEEQQRWFKRELFLMKEIERLQAIEVESDLKFSELEMNYRLLLKERDMWKSKAKEWELKRSELNEH